MGQSPPERALEQLQRLGLSQYEAKAYLALATAEGPLTGYEVAKTSGVPRSTIYEVLGKLVVRGVAFQTREEPNTSRWLSLPLTAFAARVRRDYEESLQALSETIPELTRPTSSLTHGMSGADAVRERARDLIRAARKELYLSLWPEEAEPLMADLQEAERRGVEIFIISMVSRSPEVGSSYGHKVVSPEVLMERVGCRLFVLAADGQCVLVGGALPSQTWGLYSEDRAVVLLAVEFIRHDIGLQLLMEHISDEQVTDLWNRDPVVRRLLWAGKSPQGRNQAD